MIPVSWTASTDQRCRPLEGPPFMGRAVLDGWESGLEDVMEGGPNTVVGKLSSHGGCFLKQAVQWGTRYPA